MKQFALFLMLLFAATQAFAAAKKITVQELKNQLILLQQVKKSDAEVANQLKQIDLSEELTAAAMNSLAALVPGPLSTEQMYVLEARSALLPPPPSDLPATPAPDAAAQQAMLAKATDYLAKSYNQLPHLSATRMSARFQDGVEAVATYSGARHSVSENTDPLWQQSSLYVRLLNTRTDPTEFENGVEKPPVAKEKIQWGPNNMTASIGPALTLATVLQEAKTSGNLQWVRWERIGATPAAVFAFNIDKKKTHFSIVYCCFPNTDTTGLVNYSNGIAGSGNASNLQTISEWKPFKAQSGYHGEIFIDPASGTVLRTITQADFKPSDFVHSEAIRTDYAPVAIGSQTLVVPVRSFTIAEVVPNGDSFAAKYAVRHSFITQNYTDYKLEGATAQR